MKHFLLFVALFCTVTASAEITGLSPEVASDLGYGAETDWGKQPVQLVLGVGQERLTRFPGPVKLRIPQEAGDVLQVRNVSQTVYWTASKPLDRTEVLVQRLDTPETYVLDVTATDAKVDSYTLYIGEPQRQAAAPPKSAKTTTAKLPGRGLRKHLLYGQYRALIRFAAQQLYAPQRLIAQARGVTRTDVAASGEKLLRGRSVSSQVLAGWTDGGLYVTAVEIKNQLNEPFVLDPRDLRGHWLAATFQHARLFPKGDGADTTAVYLVSPVPFDEAVQ